ncbi:MAG: YggS family pyridoxal phosphate-dependent enzyme [Pyrinomonadaceae bacterium]
MAEIAISPGILDERLVNVRRRIEIASRRCNRSPDEVSLIAIGKNHPAEVLRLALAAGLHDLGENRVQEAEAKINALGRHAARWHLVGHLQANKARRAVKLFDLIHSLDSAALALRLDRLCVEEGREQLPILIQVDLGYEETKSGVRENVLSEVVTALKDCPRLRLDGLMTLPPFYDNPERARPFFRKLREIRDRLEGEGHFAPNLGELSMGMTNDFEIAFEEGATMVRIGTAIFGEREAV